MKEEIPLHPGGLVLLPCIPLTGPDFLLPVPSPLASQFDVTWIVIRALQAVGLAHNVKLPTEKQLDKLRIVKTPQKASAA